MLKRCVSFITAIAFVAVNILPAAAQSVVLPTPGTMVGLSTPFQPVIFRGIKLDPKQPFRFDFIVDQGDRPLQGEAFNDESRRLASYFLASLTIPEKDLWVNLSPYENNRIIEENFGRTTMGRDILAVDYLLKQITSSLMYPDSELGKKFWAEVYRRAYEKFGTTDIPVDTFNKVWIVPQKAVVYEKADPARQGVSAYIDSARLKVMLDTDYFAAAQNASVGQPSGAPEAKDEISPAVIREVIIPVLEEEVNNGQNFAQLRQVYYSMLLAVWFKKKLTQGRVGGGHILSDIFIDRKKTVGNETSDPKAEIGSIYSSYVEAFKKGAYNLIREEQDLYSQELIPRKYFSGGLNLFNASKVIEAHDGEAASVGQTANADRVTIDLQSAGATLKQGADSWDNVRDFVKNDVVTPSFLEQLAATTSPLVFAQLNALVEERQCSQLVFILTELVFNARQSHKILRIMKQLKDKGLLKDINADLLHGIDSRLLKNVDPRDIRVRAQSRDGFLDILIEDNGTGLIGDTLTDILRRSRTIKREYANEFLALGLDPNELVEFRSNHGIALSAITANLSRLGDDGRTGAFDIKDRTDAEGNVLGAIATVRIPLMKPEEVPAPKSDAPGSSRRSFLGSLFRGVLLTAVAPMALSLLENDLFAGERGLITDNGLKQFATMRVVKEAYDAKLITRLNTEPANKVEKGKFVFEVDHHQTDGYTHHFMNDFLVFIQKESVNDGIGRQKATITSAIRPRTVQMKELRTNPNAAKGALSAHTSMPSVKNQAAIGALDFTGIDRQAMAAFLGRIKGKAAKAGFEIVYMNPTESNGVFHVSVFCKTPALLRLPKTDAAQSNASMSSGLKTASLVSLLMSVFYFGGAVEGEAKDMKAQAPSYSVPTNNVFSPQEKAVMKESFRKGLVHILQNVDVKKEGKLLTSDVWHRLSVSEDELFSLSQAYYSGLTSKEQERMPFYLRSMFVIAEANQESEFWAGTIGAALEVGEYQFLPSTFKESPEVMAFLNKYSEYMHGQVQALGKPAWKIPEQVSGIAAQYLESKHWSLGQLSLYCAYKANINFNSAINKADNIFAQVGAKVETSEMKKLFASNDNRQKLILALASGIHNGGEGNSTDTWASALDRVVGLMKGTEHTDPKNRKYSDYMYEVMKSIYGDTFLDPNGSMPVVRQGAAGQEIGSSSSVSTRQGEIHNAMVKSDIPQRMRKLFLDKDGNLNSFATYIMTMTGDRYSSTQVFRVLDNVYQYGDSVNDRPGNIWKPNPKKYKRSVDVIDSLDGAYKKMGYAGLKDMVKRSLGDRAEKVGGVDLNSSWLNMDVQGQGGTLNYQFTPEQVKTLDANVPGFVPVIVNSAPVADVSAFLGFK
ncbi:MAG: hypothetical protein WCO69_02215 [Candidatus Omnitrophota bacterium]